MRLFIPATLPMLEILLTDGEMPVRSGTAFAATPALVESYAEGDLEEIEHVAFLEAARASIPGAGEAASSKVMALPVRERAVARARRVSAGTSAG